MTVYAAPGTEGSVVSYKSRYENWIGGEWVPPVKGQYFENPSPVTGKTFCEVARGTACHVFDLGGDRGHERQMLRIRIARRRGGVEPVDV